MGRSCNFIVFLNLLKLIKVILYLGTEGVPHFHIHLLHTKDTLRPHFHLHFHSYIYLCFHFHFHQNFFQRTKRPLSLESWNGTYSLLNVFSNISLFMAPLTLFSSTICFSLYHAITATLQCSCLINIIFV